MESEISAIQPIRKRQNTDGAKTGRKKLNDPTKVMRVPVAILVPVLDLIAEHRKKFAQ